LMKGIGDQRVVRERWASAHEQERE